MKRTVIPVAVAAATAAAVVTGTLLMTSPRGGGDAETPLLSALAADPRTATDAVDRTDVFSAFVPDTMTIEEKAATLEDNGFACVIAPANVEGNRHLTCHGRAGQEDCGRWAYYAYVTRGNRYLESLGTRLGGC